MVLLDPSPIPNLHLTTVPVQERSPDDRYPSLHTVHKARDDVYQWCKSRVIEWYTSSQALSVGNKWREPGCTHIHEGQNTYFVILDPQAAGQRAARDIYFGMFFVWTVTTELNHPLYTKSLSADNDRIDWYSVIHKSLDFSCPGLHYIL